MRLTRRSLLHSMLLASPVVAGLRKRALAAGPGRSLMLICDAMGPDIDPSRLRAFLDPLVARGLKLGLLLGGVDASSLALACAAPETESIEWIIDRPAIAAELPYFQMRQAAAAQQAFAGLRSRCAAQGAASACGLTLACRAPAAGAMPALDGIRSAGFRTLLVRPDQDTPVEYWVTNNGILQVHGGLRTRLSALDAVIAAAFDAIDARYPLVVYLALDELAGISAEAAHAMAESFAAVIAAGMRDGAIDPTLPSDFHLANAAAARFIALHFELDPAPGASHPALLDALAAGGIPFSYSGPRSGDGALSNAAACVSLDRLPTDPDRQWLQTMVARSLAADEDRYAPPRACVVAEGDVAGLPPAIAETGAAVIVSAGDRSPDRGLDQAGLLHMPAGLRLGGRDAIPAAGLDATLGDGRGRLRDAVIVIRADPASDGSATRLLDAALLSLVRDKDNLVVDLPGLARRVMPADPIFALLQRARAQDFTASDEPAEIDADAQARLRADADLAWRYFTDLADPRSGLALGAAQRGDGNLVGYPFLTMWDVGSHILATIAALTIGIIDQDVFSDRMARILQSIPATDLGGLVLPQANISTRQQISRDRNFNASDTGRLLVALKILQTRFGLEQEVARLVDRWDLPKVVAGNRLHDVKDGRLKDYFESNYVGYAARGFALWGLEVASPYAVETVETGTDRDMRLLNRVAALGPIGTEPHVLEELELGYSEPARLIARLLFAAQLSGYEATGRFYCVSEVPLDREPWFSYQGFQLGAEGDPWVVATVSKAAEYRAARFRAGTSMISTKGAYAWAAAHPHPYTRALLSYVGERTRIEGLGFASGVYVETGRPTQGYSDCNTNAVILESIAYMLNGRRPMLNPA